jgi:hypothetical protein
VSCIGIAFKNTLLKEKEEERENEKEEEEEDISSYWRNLREREDPGK